LRRREETGKALSASSGKMYAINLNQFNYLSIIYKVRVLNRSFSPKAIVVSGFLPESQKRISN
jgi:hypothetical protein